jgi:hypothetical protein
MCRTDSFGERGIVRLHGYGSEHWRVELDFAVPIVPRLGGLGVLLEPASVLAKAWDQVDQISRRAFFLRGRALVTGTAVGGGWPSARSVEGATSSAAGGLFGRLAIVGGWHRNSARPAGPRLPADGISADLSL